MKKLLAVVLIGLMIGACKKEKSDTNVNSPKPVPTYSDTLAGTWSLTAVSYYAEIPNPQGGTPIPASGNGTAVEGFFIISKDPNKVNYDYSFNASVTLPIVGTTTIPVQQQGTGIWTVSSDNKKVFLELENQQVSALEVVENKEKKQVFRSIIPYDMALLGTIEVDALITLERD